MIVVLRVSGVSVDLEACMQWIPANLLDTSWRVGERRGRRVAKTNGFTLLLSERGGTGALAEHATAALSEVADCLRKLVEAGASVEVDIGIFVESRASQSIRVSRDTMSLLLRCGASLVVSAYPCSEDG